MASGAERGEATIEFIGLTAIVVLPLIYLIVAIASLQSCAMCVQSAAVSVAQVYARSGDWEVAQAQAKLIAQDYGLEYPLDVEVKCGKCQVGDSLTVTVVGRPNVPGMPFSWASNLSVPISKTFATVVVAQKASGE